MKQAFFILIAMSLLSGLHAGNAPEERLQKAVDESLAAAARATTNADLTEKMRPIAQRNMSFSVMTRRAIGPGWKSFSTEQQARATQLFAELLIRRYTERFTIGEKPSVTYKPALTPAPGRMEIPTLFFYKGNRYEVIYRIEQSEDWRITDIVIEGVSFIANYRSQLNAQYQKGGAVAVLDALSQAVKNPG